MKNSRLQNVGNIVSIFLYVFAVIGILVMLFLYPLTKIFGIHYDLFIIMIYPCGISFIYLIYQFIKLFETLKINDPFCYENVTRFKKSMYCANIITIFVIIALFISIFKYNYYSLQLKVAIAFIAFLFFCFSVCFYILSCLFNKAHKYKEENDLTI